MAWNPTAVDSYRTEPIGKHGSFEIHGVSKEAREVFSTRRTQILEAYAQLDHQNDQTRDAVTIKTRRGKSVIGDRGALHEVWRERAAAAGIDLAPVVDHARATVASTPSRWERITGQIEKASERARAVSAYVAERIGLREKDPLEPAQPWRMSGPEQAAAHAVAAAVRHLSQREAAFKSFDIYKTALDFGLPITIDRVEARVQALTRKGVLIGGAEPGERMMTTASAIEVERAIVARSGEGRGMVDAIATPDGAGARLQAHAAASSGHRLNPGQEGAGRLILASTDRIVAVQGVAGAGKSSMLAPVARVLEEEGRRVVGLGFQNKMVRDLGEGAGIEARTIASFLGSHKRVLDGTASQAMIGHRLAEWRGAFVVVDESSMVSNDQKLQLITLANKLELGRLVFVGDKKQLGAIDAGKPFEMLQRTGTDTAQMPDNLRARGEVVRTAAAALQDGRVGDALAALRPHTVEAKDRLAEHATELWLALPDGERDRTAIFVSGRAHKAAVNQLVQSSRAARGELGEASFRTKVLDPVSTTREQVRHLNTYETGQVLDVQRRHRNVGVGLADVLRVDHARGVVIVRDAQGRERELRPDELDRNAKEDLIRIHREKELEVREQDRIRWGSNDKERGLFNADIARVTKAGVEGITVQTSAGIDVTLRRGDPMLNRIDLAYALNAHMAQGTTADHAIAILDSRERNLATERLALVTATRVRDSITLVTDNASRLEQRLTENSGAKTSALEVTRDLLVRDRTATTPPPAPTRERQQPTKADIPVDPRGSRAPEIERKIGEGGGRTRQMELGL